MPLQQQEIRKHFRGREWVLQIVGESRFELTDTLDGSRQTYGSMTAAAHAVRGDDQSVNGWDFFGVRNPNARTRSVTRITATGEVETVDVKIGGKCKHEGCYEPSDCKHGFCSQHCHRHEIGSYSARKYPRTDALHIGVEVEVTYKDANDFRRGVGIDCHRDGSLGSFGAEYKLCCRSDKIVQEAAELVEALWKRRARVNRSCGLHVHIDARQVGQGRRQEVIDWLQRTEEVWFSLMPPSRRTSSYARKLAENFSSHYTWANYSPYNTLEIRLHGGTLNPYKVAGWLTALIHLQKKMNDATYTFPSTGDAETDFWELFEDCPQVGKEYLATRKANGGIIRDNAYAHVEE